MNDVNNGQAPFQINPNFTTIPGVGMNYPTTDCNQGTPFGSGKLQSFDCFLHAYQQGCAFVTYLVGISSKITMNSHRLFFALTVWLITLAGHNSLLIKDAINQWCRQGRIQGE